MKVLLDECLPQDFRRSLSDHEVHTVQYAGLKGAKNGVLLSSAEFLGYQVLLTVDQSIPFQQPLNSRNISVVILKAATNQLEDLLKLVDLVKQTLKTLQPGQIVQIG